MVEFSITNWRYGYLHDKKWPSEAVDTHHVVVLGNKNGSKRGLVAALILAHAFYLFRLEDKSSMSFSLIFILDACLAKLVFSRPVAKESVVVMPTFGVQLETHHVSGKVIRRFVPIDRILKPVLVECVTPVTCYWSLSLIIQGEAELMLVFKELRPPLKILVPIWKALCAATGSNNGEDTRTKDIQ